MDGQGLDVRLLKHRSSYTGVNRREAEARSEVTELSLDSFCRYGGVQATG